MLKMTSCVRGWAERMNDSLQQVHSSPWSHTTGIRGLFSMAEMTCGTTEASSPTPPRASEVPRNQRGDFDDGVGELAHGAKESGDESAIKLRVGTTLEF